MPSVKARCKALAKSNTRPWSPRQRHGLEQRCVRVLRLTDGGHVEIRLVDGHGLDHRPGLGGDLHDGP